MVKLTRYSSIKKRHFNEAMAHLAAMDFFGLRYCLIMDPFVQPQRAVPHSPMRPYNLWTKGIPLEILKKGRNALATTLDNRQP